MLARNKLIEMVFVVAVCLSITTNAHALMMWNNASGSGAYFDWQGGGSDNGLFGDPILVAQNTTIVFTPDNWVAESLDGVSSIVGDRMEVTFLAHQGFSFDQVVIEETGDYAILGTGAVAVNGAAFAVDNVISRVDSDELMVTPPNPMTGESGIWNATVRLDLSGERWTDFTLVFDNNLMATSDLGSASLIQKKVITITFVPEPGLLVLLLTGLVPMILKRRMTVS